MAIKARNKSIALKISGESFKESLFKSGIGGVIKVLAGNGSYVVLGFIANLVTANGLSPASFGLVSLGLAMLNVLQEICGIGVDMAMVRLAAPHIASNPLKSHQYYKASLQIKLLINGIVALVIWSCSTWIASAIYQNLGMIPYIQWVALGLIGAAIYNYMLARFQVEERFTVYAVLRVLNNLTKLLILGALWWFYVFQPVNVMAAWIASFFVSFGIALLFKDRTKHKQKSLTVNLQYWREIFDFGKWVVASSFLFALYSRTDLFILGRFANAGEVGQYAAAWNITFVIDLLTYSIIIALLPKAARLCNVKEFTEYIQSTFLICLLLSVLLLPLYFFSDWIFSVLFPKYQDSSEIFNVLFWGAIVTLLFHPIYLILYSRNRVNYLAFVNFILVVFCAILGIVIIPEHGTLGAAGVIVTGRGVAAVLICYFVYKELRSMRND